MLDKTKTTTLYTPDALIQWLRKQRADEEYVWSDPIFCMMGRYLADNGSTWGEASYSDMPGYDEIANTKPWTFGAALKRAEALTEIVKLLPPPALLIEQDKSRDLVPVQVDAHRDVPH
jgi:hypothetical protein